VVKSEKPSALLSFFCQIFFVAHDHVAVCIKDISVSSFFTY
jgi:hypothetical protein